MQRPHHSTASKAPTLSTTNSHMETMVTSMEVSMVDHSMAMVVAVTSEGQGQQVRGVSLPIGPPQSLGRRCRHQGAHLPILRLKHHDLSWEVCTVPPAPLLLDGFPIPCNQGDRDHQAGHPYWTSEHWIAEPLNFKLSFLQFCDFIIKIFHSSLHIISTIQLYMGIINTNLI